MTVDIAKVGCTLLGAIFFFAFSYANVCANVSDNSVTECLKLQFDQNSVDLDQDVPIVDLLSSHQERAEQICAKAIDDLLKERRLLDQYLRLVHLLDRTAPFRRIAGLNDEVIRTRDEADKWTVHLAQKQLDLSKESNLALTQIESTLANLDTTRLSWTSRWAQLHLLQQESPFDSLASLQKDPISPSAIKIGIQSYFDSFPPYMMGRAPAPAGALDKLSSSLTKLAGLLELRRKNYRAAQYKEYLHRMRSTLSPEAREQADRDVALRIVKEFEFSEVLVSGYTMLASGVYLAPRQVAGRLIYGAEQVSDQLNLSDPEAVSMLGRGLKQMKELKYQLEHADAAAMELRISRSIEEFYNTIVTRHHHCLKQKPSVFDAFDSIDGIFSKLRSFLPLQSVEGRQERQELRELAWLIMSSVLNECEGK